MGDFLGEEKPELHPGGSWDRDAQRSQLQQAMEICYNITATVSKFVYICDEAGLLLKTHNLFT